jgi:hypothetical protein
MCSVDVGGLLEREIHDESDKRLGRATKEIFEGRITDKCSVVAFAERRAMLELALRLKGDLAERDEVGAQRSLEEILAESWSDNSACGDPSEEFVR